MENLLTGNTMAAAAGADAVGAAKPSAPKVSFGHERTDAEIGALPATRIAGVPEAVQTGTFAARAAEENEERLIAALERRDAEAEEAFAGTPSADVRDRLEYARLEARARLMQARPESFGDEEVGAVFRELNRRRFVANDSTLAAFDALDGEGKVTNRSRLADFLAFSDRLAAAKSPESQQILLDDKFASPELKAWRMVTGGREPSERERHEERLFEDPQWSARVAGYAREKMAARGRDWGDRARDAFTAAKRWVKDGVDGAPDEAAEATRRGMDDYGAYKEYARTLADDEERAAAARLMPYLSKAQRDLVNLYAAGGEVGRGVFLLMKPDDREMMYRMIHAVRPTADLNWLAEGAARIYSGARNGVRGGLRAVEGLDYGMRKWTSVALTGRDDLFGATPTQRRMIRDELLDDIRWAQATHDLKLEDPRGFLEKALGGYADSFALQGSAVGGAALKRAALYAPHPAAKGALAVSGALLQGYMAWSMVGEQFENMLMRGVDVERAAPLAVCGGLIDSWIENANVGVWLGAKGISPADMKRVGLRAAFRASLKMDWAELAKVMRVNGSQFLKITASEVAEEMAQAMDKEGWCSVAEGREIMRSFLGSKAWAEAGNAFVEALPTCTAFGLAGAANVTGSVARGADSAYARYLDGISHGVARRRGVEELGEAGRAAALRVARNEAQRVVNATKGMSAKDRDAWINAQTDLTLSEKDFLRAHCDFYEATRAQDGEAWANALLSGSIDEALFAKAGWKFEHDENGWINAVTTSNGKRFKVDFINRAATVDDFTDAEIAAFVAEWNRTAKEGERLTGRADPRLAEAVAKTNGLYDAETGTVVLFGARADGGTLGHEATHGVIAGMQSLHDRETKRALKAVADAFGGRVEGGKLDVGTDEAVADRVEEKVRADILFAMENAAPERVDVKALAKNVFTALGKAVGLGKGRAFLPVIRRAEGAETNPEEYLHDIVARSLVSYAARQKIEQERRDAVAEARKRQKAEREEKRQRKIRMRAEARAAETAAPTEGAPTEGASDPAETAAPSGAETAAKDAAEVEAEIAAEEQREIDEINRKAEAERKLLEDEERKRREEDERAEAERQRKMEEKMLRNRKNAVKTMPKFHAPKGTDEAAAKRMAAAYEAAWRAKSGKFITQADVDMLAEVYGLPPEALNLKRMGGGYRLVKQQLLSDASLARFEEGLERFYDDILGVEIEVPDVVVGSVEEAANAVPNEVWDPVSETFIEGRVVVDAANAKSFREQAGLKDETSPTVTPPAPAPTVTPGEVIAEREGGNAPRAKVSPALRGHLEALVMTRRSALERFGKGDEEFARMMYDFNVKYVRKQFAEMSDEDLAAAVDALRAWDNAAEAEGARELLADATAERAKRGGGKTRFSIDVGDSLSDRGKYEQVVDALSVRNAAPTNVLAADATPKDAAQHFAKNLLGKVLTMPDGETFEIRAGHFFRLTCEGKHKGFVEGYRNGEEAFAAIVNGEVKAEKINGYRQDRAVMLPLFSDVVEHPSVVLKNGNVSQFIKRYETADGRAMTAVFRMFEDGRKILSFHGFGARYGELKHYRVAYVSDAARAGTSPATSGLGTGSRADGGIVSQNGAGAQGGAALPTGTRFSISHLYTGSAADYEKPSLVHVGTGEGSQVYGWGLYASNVRGVAERYANNGFRFEHNGKRMPIYIDDDTAQGLAEFTLRGCSGHVDMAINVLKRDQRYYQERGLSDDKTVKAIEYLRNHGNEYKFTRGVPHVYEQTFFTNRAPGDESHLLNWYEPVSKKQLKWIEDGAKNAGLDVGYDIRGEMYIDNPRSDSRSTGGENGIRPMYWENGQDAYKSLARFFGSPKAASEFLARAGIDGVKYPVDSYGSKGVKDGDKVGWNYVSFRDDNITVDHKWVNGETRFSMRVNPNLRREVDEVVVGRRADGSKVGRHGRVVFSSMPDILKWLGLPDLEIETDRARIAKIIAKHHLTTEQIADLPNRYDKPASVFRDGANAYVVLTDMIGKTNGGADKPVMVRLTRKDGRKGETVFVASAYSRESDKEVEYVRLANTPGAALFVDKDKVATLGLEEGTMSTLCTLADRDDVVTPEDFSSWATANSLPQTDGVAQGGIEIGGEGIVEKVKRLARPAEPGADAPRFSIGDRSAANVAKFYLAREIMENKGRLPPAARAARVARALGYGGSVADLLSGAEAEAAKQTQLLRVLASDPKTEKALAAAGLALRNERAIERARSAAIQFSREVGEAATATTRAAERAARAVRGEDYERMLVREGLDLDAILRAIRPAEREAGGDGEKDEDKEKGTPAPLTDEERALVAKAAAEAIANGADAIAKAKEAIRAKEAADAAKAKDGATTDGGEDADGDEDSDTAAEGDDGREGVVARAIRETIAKAGFTLESPEAMVQLVKAVTEKYVRDFPAEFAGVDMDDVWSSPLVRAKFSANLASFAQSVADAYAPSYARVRIASMAQALDDKGFTTLRQIEEAGEALFRDLHGDVIRQTRAGLIGEIRKLVRPHAKHYKENELTQERKGVDSALGRYCTFAYRVMRYSAKKCEERAAQLEQELAAWSGVADAEKERIREFADKKTELEMIDMFGNLRDRMPAELAELRDFVEQTINESRWEVMQYGEKWEKARSEAAQRIAAGIVGDPKRGGVKPEAEETSGLYSLIGMFETKARQLTRWATGAARDESLRAFGAVEEMIQRAEDAQFNYMQREKAKFVDLCKSVYGDHVKAGRALTAEIDRSLWDSLDRGGQKTAWTVGRVMQMYVSCVQSDYADNCAKWGRDAAYVRHLEDVLNGIDPRHMDFIEGMRAIYREQGDALDEVMRRTTGTRLLTPGRNYMPVRMFRNDNIARKARARAYSPFAPSLTPRVRNGLDFSQDVDIVDLWQERMEDAAHTVAWADTGSMVQGVLQSDSVLRAIRDGHGDKALGQWQRYVLDILAGAEQGRVDSSNWGLAAMRFCARLASRTWLALNPASWAKQLAAVPCFALSGDGSLRSVAKSVSFVALRPFEAAKVMRDLADTRAFQARYGVAISQEMKYATSGEGQFRNWISRLMDWSMKGIMGFDKLGVYALAGVYHQKRCELESQGKGADEASELASSWLMHVVDKTAQTTRSLNTTELQRAGGAWGILLQFKSAPAQQTQFEIGAIQEALAHPEDMKRWKRAAVCVLINHVIVPTINTAIESVVACLTSLGLPDEEKRRRLVEMWIANVVSGSLGSIVFLGTVAEGVGSILGKVATGEKVGMYDIGGELGRQMPAAEMLKLWFTQAGKLGDACLEIKEGDIAEGAVDFALAIGKVTPGFSWLTRKFGKPAKEYFFGK